VREARKTTEPDPVWAAAAAQLGGADGITIHLRVDRRHINDRDVRLLKETTTVKLNLEMSLAEEIVGIACDVRPEQCSLVPEKREEVTTEGGLDVRGQLARVKEGGEKLKGRGVTGSLFVDSEEDQLRASSESGADAVELHTRGAMPTPAGRTRAESSRRCERERSSRTRWGSWSTPGTGSPTPTSCPSRACRTSTS